MSGQLSDDVKERILMEERFRAEVRRKMEEPATNQSGLLKFVNSAFGLWLLSAIFLSGVGTVYNHWQKERAATQAKAARDTEMQKLQVATDLARRRQIADTIEKLDLEISYRFLKALMELNKIHATGQASSPGGSGPPTSRFRDTVAVLEALSHPPDADDAALFAVYRSYALPTLLGELRRIVPTAERDEIDGALAGVVGLSDQPEFKAADPAKEAAGWIQNQLKPRWKRSWFYYVDCSAEMPFC